MGTLPSLGNTFVIGKEPFENDYPKIFENDIPWKIFTVLQEDLWEKRDSIGPYMSAIQKNAKYLKAGHAVFAPVKVEKNWFTNVWEDNSVTVLFCSDPVCLLDINHQKVGGDQLPDVTVLGPLTSTFAWYIFGLEGPARQVINDAYGVFDFYEFSRSNYS